jgi:hypothetical protein
LSGVDISASCHPEAIAIDRRADELDDLVTVVFPMAR